MALIASVRKNYPHVQFFLLVTEEFTTPDFNDKSVIVVNVSDLSIPSKELEWLRSYYDLVEFATALKPHLLLYILRLKFESVIFLDPDMLLLDKIDDVFSIAETSSAVLTPHRISPIRMGVSFYTDSTFLQFGTFNLGFIAVGMNSVPFLEWWAERLQFFCTRHVEDLYFTDQKWVNLAPAYFECTILKDPGLNLAPWNLDERPLKFQNNKLYSKDVKLRLVHFSQMSSDLAAGKTSNLWSTMFKDHADESIEIIERITAEYSENLIQIKETLGLNSYPKSKGRNSTLYKVLKLASYEKGYKNSILGMIVENLIDFTKLLNAFDKSVTYSSLIRAIPKDLVKVRKRLSVPKKPKPS